MLSGSTRVRLSGALLCQVNAQAKMQEGLRSGLLQQGLEKAADKNSSVRGLHSVGVTETPEPRAWLALQCVLPGHAKGGCERDKRQASRDDE